MPLKRLSKELIAHVLSSVSNLRDLKLSNNEIVVVENLDGIETLSEIDLSHNFITSLDDGDGCLSRLPRLQALQLHSNRLNSLDGFAALTTLEILDLRNNSIGDFTSLGQLKGLPRLKHLCLEGNPIHRFSHYKQEVIRRLPRLHSLDGVVISETEKALVRLSDANFHASVKNLEIVNEPVQPVQLDGPHQHNCAHAPLPTFERQDCVGLRAQPASTLEQPDRANNPIVARNLAGAPFQMSAAASPSLQGDLSGGVVGACNPRQFASPLIVEAAADPSQARFVGNDYVGLLQTQLESLQNILRLQENEMGECAARVYSHASRNDSKREEISSVSAAYQGTLSAWRQKVFKLLVTKKDLESKVVSLKREYEDKLNKESSSKKVVQKEVTLLAERLKNAEIQAELFSQKIEALHKEMEVRSTQFQASQESLRQWEDCAKQLETVVIGFHSRTKDTFKAQLTRVLEGATKMGRYEQRLRFAAERLRLAGTFVQQRHVQLRNAQACLEADKRQWKYRTHACHNQEKIGGTAKGEGKSGSSSQQQFVIRGLHPECEGAMRGIFSAIDNQCENGSSGKVPKRLLWHSLYHSTDVATLVYRRQYLPHAGVACNVGSSSNDLQDEPELPRELWVQLMESMACSWGWKYEDFPIARPNSVDTHGSITWGEFLLFFMPTPVHTTTVLWHDTHFSESNSQLNSHEHWDQVMVNLNFLNPSEVREELQTAIKERHVLHQKYKSCADVIFQRAEDVRQVWERSYNDVSQQREDATQKLQDRCRQVEVLQTEIERCKETLQQKETNFIQSQEIMRRELESVDKTSNAAIKSVQSEANTRTEELEEEVRALKREQSLNVVTTRQLERELRKTKEELENEMKTRVQCLEECVSKRDMELGQMRKERNSLLAALREQERKMSLMAKDHEECQNSSTEECQNSSALPLSLLATQGDGNDKKDEILSQLDSIAAELKSSLQN
jgi:cell division septum initiation protein DivIVA